MKHNDEKGNMQHNHAIQQADHTMHEEGNIDHKHKDHHADHSGHEKMFRKRFWISLLISIPVLLYSQTIQNWLNFKMPAFPGSQWLVPVFSIVIFIYGGLPFIKMAVPELKNRKPGMMALISLAISVAFIYSISATIFNLGDSFYWELVTLIDIMLLGHWMEMRSVRQASGSLNELAKLMPDTAERIDADGSTHRISLSQLNEGDLVLVRPGENIPADGIVKSGESKVNEAMITGESKRVNKESGSRVIGGTLNEEGSLRVSVTATGDKTALAGIMRLVAEAQQSKSRTQLLADRAAAWLFYIALSVAVLTAITWSLATGLNVGVLKRVVTVLVIACPHALGLAVPLVVAISTSLGANNGILVRDRLALEMARELDIIIFDKTGTLTTGEFGVAAMTSINDWEGKRALALAAALEGDSEHLIARAVRSKAQHDGAAPLPISDFKALKGRGVSAVYDGKPVYIGGPQLLDYLGLQASGEIASFSDREGKKGHSVIYLILEKKLLAAFGLADMVRLESKTVVQLLNKKGIEVAMLTGDSKQVAGAVADELGIDRVFAEVLPEDKDKIVQKLQDEGKKVAMVGDGVNDAPALTRADVGIAIGSGTDVAVESAGLILVKDNPLDVVRIIRLSQATYRKMVQNLAWATGYNLIALPLAAGVLAPWGILLSPAVGAVLMSLSTVVVALNAQFLRQAILTLD